MQDVEILSVTIVNSIRTALYCQELVGIDLVHMIKDIPDSYHGIVLKVKSFGVLAHFNSRNRRKNIFLNQNLPLEYGL